MTRVLNILWFLVLSLQNTEQSRWRYVTYNSTDLSYFSNGIQFPGLQELTSSDNKTQNLSDIEYLRKLFDHMLWNDRLKFINNTECREDMSHYLSELKNSTLWATRIYDASGRYNDQFFFGNDFWLGSKPLCEELRNPMLENHTVPFYTHYYIVKVRMNVDEDLTPVTRQINLGQCLPKSCGIDDVRTLILNENYKGKFLTILHIRSIPSGYSLLNDKKFYAIGGTGVIVGLLVLIASFVEYFINKNKKQNSEEKSEYNNNNNNNICIESNKDLSTCNSQISLKSKKGKSERNIFIKLILCFSAITNGKKMLSMDATSEDSIRCIHGLRCFSIFWIVLVHTYLCLFAVSENKTLRFLTEKNILYQTISNATFSVDTFFFISGLLLSITYFKKDTSKEYPTGTKPLSKSLKDGSIKYGIFIFYRYLRLTPIYMFVLGMNILAMKFSRENSVIPPATRDDESCSVFWWRNALYINNFYPLHEFCMIWSWYMANDMQFFIVGMLLLSISGRGKTYFKWIVGVLGTLLVLSWVTTFSISWIANYHPRVETPFELFDQLYNKPWFRFGPYAVGLVIGYMLVKVKKLVIHPLVLIFGWTCSTVCALSVIYGFGPDGIRLPLSAVYGTFSHTAWGLCIAWITVVCYYGYGGPVNNILSFRGLMPMSRLTFSVYLVHPVVMIISGYQLDGPFHLHNSLVIITFFGNVVASLLIAGVLSILFEAPILQLLKLFFRTNKN